MYRYLFFGGFCAVPQRGRWLRKDLLTNHRRPCQQTLAFVHENRCLLPLYTMDRPVTTMTFPGIWGGCGLGSWFGGCPELGRAGWILVPPASLW